MKQVISTERLPIKMWLDDIEPEALQQAKNLANLPFAFKHISIMPDAHCGYGMPIGGILATKDVVVPNAVGVDIGCGMHAVKTSLKDMDTETLKNVMGKVRECIPVGFNHRKEPLELHMPKLTEFGPVVKREYQSATYQIGTLGGGNHFIEFQKGSDGYIWFMIHSGSRNLGKKVCDYYNKLAKELNEKWFSSVSKNVDLAFLPLDSDIGQDYLKEMSYCVKFASYNRQVMSMFINLVMSECIQTSIFSLLEEYDIAHNYAVMEHHFGENVLIHRKGATRAYKNEIGIIPGSQGTVSYIVKGLGNPESFMSCSHGAGRNMSRTKARNTLNLQDEIGKMDNLGIVHGIRHQSDLDEAAGAYKDIKTVMKNQTDLVDTVLELKPLGVIKG